jgi:hypothetical protein
MRMPVQRFNFIDTARDNLVAKFKGAWLAFARRSCLAACCVARAFARAFWGCCPQPTPVGTGRQAR